MPRVFKTPGVYKEEIDLSNILIAAGISNGGTVIRSVKGPINRPVLVTNDKEFVETFGKPYFTSGVNTLPSGLSLAQTKKLIPEYGYGSYAALAYLQESENLYVVRGYTDGTDQYANAAVNANLSASTYTSAQYNVTTISATTDGNPDRVDKIYSIDQVVVSPAALLVAALYPGEDGNSTAVTIEVATTACDWLNSYDAYTSATAITAHPIASKVFKINVYTKDTTAAWTDFQDTSIASSATSAGLRMTPAETFYGTLTPQVDGNNNQLYIENVINGVSKFIYVKTGTGSFSTMADTSLRPIGSDSVGDFVYLSRLIQLASGVYTMSTGIGSTNGWNMFNDRELVNVGILICPDWTQQTKIAVANVVASRLDCIASVQAGTLEDNSVTAVQARETYGYAEPSYLAIYCGWSKIYDNYNNKFVYVPNAIYGGSLMARCDAIANPWNAPAGIDRATLSVFDQLKVFNTTDIGNLYDVNINSLKFIRGTGYVMWGQKTAQQKKSALDRVNVRRMLLYVENNIETALLPFVFENNTDKTRLRIFSLVDEFMSGVKAGGGVTAYEVVCDDTNNTATVIDSNQLNVDLYVQPSRTAEFIKFTTVVTRTGISFSTVRIA